MCHLLHDGLRVIRKVVRGDADDYANDQAYCGSAPDSPLKAGKKRCDNGRQNQKNGCRGIGGGIQRAGGIAFFADSGTGDSDDGSDQPQGGIAEYHGSICAEAAVQRLAHDEGGGHGGHVGIEQIGAHAGHVAHVVAHVVSDDSGISGIILRNAKFHLSGQVRRHIRRFGENAAARLCEESEGAGAKGKAQQDGGVRRNQKHGHDAQQAEAHHRKAHDRTAAEADQKRGFQILFRPFRGASIGRGGHQDADFPGDGGEDRTRQISGSHRDMPDQTAVLAEQASVPERFRKKQENQNGGHAREPGEDTVFPSHKGIGARLDQRGNFNDPFVFGGLLFHP